VDKSDCMISWVHSIYGSLSNMACDASRCGASSCVPALKWQDSPTVQQLLFVGNQQVIFIALDRIIIIMQTRSNLQHGSPQYLWLSGQVEGALVYWGYHLSWISSGCWWVVDTRLLSISCIACAKWPRPIRDQTCTFQYKFSPTSYQVNHGCAIAMCYQLSVMEPRRCKGTRDLLAFVSKLGT
jgi:hypothetical protein